MKDRMLYGGLSGFVSGILLRSFVDVGFAFSALFVLFGALLFLCSPFSISPLEKGKGESKVMVLAAVFLLSAGFGMLRYDFADRSGPQTALDSRLGQSVVLEGVVIDEPDERESVTRLILRVEKAKTKILITTGREPKYAYGDRLSVQGKVAWPKNFTDETTLREVDYVSHLGKDGIYYEMFLPKIEMLARGEGNPVIGKLFAFKRAFISTINSVIPEPHAALLAGLIVGAKQSLGKKLLDDFRTTGIIHIVVLSGYNLTIIAAFIEWLFSFLSRNKRFLLGSAAIILFAIMVGASATVVRATIMALLVILARSTGRLYAVTRALLLAGFLMLLHNPKILVFDTSFQLSFLATVGLIYLSPMIEPRVRFVTERWKLREIVVATIATQIFVLPFLLYKTGLFSVVSLPVNLLILAIIPATMLSGFLAGMFGFFGAMFAAPFAWIAYALLSYELFVVDWFASLPLASFTFPSFPLWLTVVWYAAYAVLLYWVYQKTQAHGAWELRRVQSEQD